MRLHNLKAAVAKSSHHVQVLFVVRNPAEVDTVNKVLGSVAGVQCQQVPDQGPAEHQHSLYYFKLSKQAT